MSIENTGLLPAGFEALEEFVEGWALALESARMEKRWSSTMEDITRFYDSMSSQIEAVLDHLDRFELKALPEREKRLQLLTLSLAEAASAVETYKQPGVKYGFATPDRYRPTDTLER